MKLIKFDADNVELNTVRMNLTLEGMNEAFELGKKLNSLVGSDVDFKAEKRREKRSLNANSYFYVLCGKIADATDASKPEVHNRMLCRYGQYMKDKDNIVFCLYPADIDYQNAEDVHLKPTGHFEDKGGIRYEWFTIMRGSHDYNTQEMAKLIDGTVSEARELGIETLTPAEIKRMEEVYKGGDE